MSSRLVAATVEVPIVFTVLPRLALTAGPTLDITFSGRGGSDVRWSSRRRSASSAADFRFRCQVPSTHRGPAGTTKGQGRKIALLLAATAIANDAVLITHDGDLLDGAISGLQVEDWY